MKERLILYQIHCIARKYTGYSKIHNYLYIGEVRKPRQRMRVGIAVH